VCLGKEVTKIDWLGHDVIVKCADGSEFVTDRVITTVSLNVLKATANDIFKPSLPPTHLKAIQVSYKSPPVLRTTVRRYLTLKQPMYLILSLTLIYVWRSKVSNTPCLK